MQWEGRRESENVEDRRGMSGGTKVLAGGGVLGLIILVVNMFLSQNGDQAIQLPQMQQQQTVQQFILF